VITRFAPAKINLNLHVGPPQADGRHPLDSLVVFAKDIGDTLHVTPSDGFALAITGPFAESLQAESDNLVLRAGRLLADHAGIKPLAHMVLEKHLPIASGIGGGSSDAAAALHGLNALWAIGASYQDLVALGAQLGADVPACVNGQPLRMTGTGESLASAPLLPALPALLVNPGFACPTGRVYQTYDGLGASPLIEPRDLPDAQGLEQAFALLSGLSNDLEAAAISCVPEIGALLERLGLLPGVRLVRMSGSGATCFALFDSLDHAFAAKALLTGEPRYWAQAGVLNG
jgi:4-diphosphocytidyl-2-C-methyl-D-erythritol kinase